MAEVARSIAIYSPNCRYSPKFHPHFVAASARTAKAIAKSIDEHMENRIQQTTEVYMQLFVTAVVYGTQKFVILKSE